jgi:hypothetical protein
MAEPIERDDFPCVDADKLTNELVFLKTLADLRDAPFDSPDVAGLPDSIKTPSWLLKNYCVPEAKAGEDFLTKTVEWERIQNGYNPSESITYGPVRLLTTLRDGATLVHGDDPYKIWGAVIDDLKAAGVPFYGSTEVVEQTDFVCGGVPTVKGIVSTAMGLCGLLSFRYKWEVMLARPEELWPVLMGSGFLPQAFPEGSPTHPSRNAMHSAIHWTAAYALKQLVDVGFVLPSGRTVGAEIDLMAGNLSDWRSTAGVHYMSDNYVFKPMAKKLAQRVVQHFGHLPMYLYTAA